LIVNLVFLMANRRIKKPRCEQTDLSAMAKTGTSRIADLAVRGIDKYAVINGRASGLQGGVGS